MRKKEFLLPVLNLSFSFLNLHEPPPHFLPDTYEMEREKGMRMEYKDDEQLKEKSEAKQRKLTGMMSLRRMKNYFEYYSKFKRRLKSFGCKSLRMQSCFAIFPFSVVPSPHARMQTRLSKLLCAIICMDRSANHSIISETC